MNIRILAFVLATLALAAIVGAIAYDAGLAAGLVRSGKLAAAPPQQPYPPYPYAYGWHHHRPWGVFFIPLFFLTIFLIARRGFCGGGYYRHHLDEWHRRAHERMWNEGPGPTTP